jgi:mono/diheme cytochrome c family protein
MSLKFSLFLAFLLVAATAVAEEQLPAPAAGPVDFARDVRPLLAKHCFDCHGADLQESNYRLDVRRIALAGGDYGEAAIVPGKSAESRLIRYVAGVDEDLTMPPQGEGDALTAAEVSLLRAWIDRGAQWPDALAGDESQRTVEHWSLQPVRNVAPPKVQSDWPTTAIDSFIFARLKAAELAPSPPADRATLIRRLYLDMHGLPPTPERVRAFVADERSDAYDGLLDEVLASPRYGERWAQHWLDIVRYADTHGFEVNTPRPNAWPYRDYVIGAFNEDKPYDAFVYEQLAGDLVGADAATGFLVAAPVLLPGQIGKDKDSMLEARQDALDEIVTATSTTFLGLTVGCARCHNHKFDPILQQDYYSLQAVFAGVQYGARPLRTPETEQHRERLEHVERQIAEVDRELAKFAVRAPVNAQQNEESIEPVAARWVRFVVEETNNREPCLDELEIFAVAKKGQPPRNVALASAGAKPSSSGDYPVEVNHRLEHINDGQYGNGRSWISSEVGGGWVQIELPKTETIDRIVWGRDRTRGYDDRLATRYRIEVAVEKDQWTTVASSATRLPFGSVASSTEFVERVADSNAKDLVAKATQLRGLKKQLQPKAAQQVYAGTFRKPDPTFRLRRGDHRQPMEQVKPDTIGVLGALRLDADAAESNRRDALAKWITSPDNPLTARVMVNRIWHYHFGAGLVDTPGDFGKMGAPPSHPELLDYLATEFVRSGWSVKHIHRLILRSQAYRQSSRFENEAARRIDAGVRLLWRFPARRLEAEAVRDSVLQVSGVLRHEMGGPGFDIFKPREGLDSYLPKDEYGPAEWRRLIYAHKVRMAQDGVFSTFDMPDCGQICSKRSRSTTPLQALNLFNSRYMVRQAGLFAERIEREVGDSVEKQVTRAFQLGLTRDPRPTEATACAEVVREHGLMMLCRVIFNTNEFVMLP